MTALERGSTRSDGRRGGKGSAAARVALALAAGAAVMSPVSCTRETVTSVDISGITVSPSMASVLDGEQLRLSATVRDADGRALNGAAVTWDVVDDGVASVDEEGTVHGRAVGSTEVRATFRGAWGAATVRVLPGSRIGLSRDSVIMSSGGEGNPRPEVVRIFDAGNRPVRGLAATVQAGAREWLFAELADTEAPTNLDLNAEVEGFSPGLYEGLVSLSADSASSVEVVVVLAVAAITVEETGGSSSVSESGTTDTLLVTLRSAPSTDVVLSVTSSDTGEVTAAPSRLRFTPSNWDEPQTVTLTGVDDDEVDGTQLSTIILSVEFNESDERFAGTPDRLIAVTTLDDDGGGSDPSSTPGLSLTESGGDTRVTEASGDGNTDRFAVALDAAPASDVVLSVTSLDVSEVLVSVLTSTLTFTPSNWSTPQTVTVSGVDDLVPDGDQVTPVVVAVTDELSDDAYDGLSETVSVTTLDDDSLVGSIGTSTGR